MRIYYAHRRISAHVSAGHGVCACTYAYTHIRRYAMYNRGGLPHAGYARYTAYIHAYILRTSSHIWRMLRTWCMCVHIGGLPHAGYTCIYCVYATYMPIPRVSAYICVYARMLRYEPAMVYGVYTHIRIYGMDGMYNRLSCMHILDMLDILRIYMRIYCAHHRISGVCYVMSRPWVYVRAYRWSTTYWICSIYCVYTCVYTTHIIAYLRMSPPAMVYVRAHTHIRISADMPCIIGVVYHMLDMLDILRIYMRIYYAHRRISGACLRPAMGITHSLTHVIYI